VIGVGLFASGVWHIERMEAGRQHTDIATPLPPPAPPGSPVAARTPKFERKERRKMIVKDLVVPETKPTDAPTDTGADSLIDPGDGPDDPDAIGTCTENCATTERANPVCGDRSVDASEQCDDGNTANGDGCSSTCRTEVVARPDVAISPITLKALRISGETQIHPSTATQNRMIHEGTSELRRTLKVCIATDGGVASATTVGQKDHDEYDERLLSAVRTWRYRPYTVNGSPVPACGMVTFAYSIK
jgi:cysteine-rich repeat protein